MAKGIDYRLWTRVDIGEDDECWEWLGSCTYEGYGQIHWHRQQLAHRVSYTLMRGDIPDGMYVCHSCDNRRCVNPRHLWLGTPEENSADMYRKGRAVKNPRRGEAHPLAKLTEPAVIEIRRRYEDGGVTQRDLAAEYGVDQQLIWRVIKRRSWTHI